MNIERIVINPEILVGKPIIKGTRLSVEYIIGLLVQGWSEQEILINYPGLTHQDINACLHYSAARLQRGNTCAMANSVMVGAV